MTTLPLLSIKLTKLTLTLSSPATIRCSLSLSDSAATAKFFKIGSKIQAKVSSDMQLKSFADQRRAADNSMWEDSDDSLLRSPGAVTPVRTNQDLLEEFEEASEYGGAIQSLSLGALENSFLVSESGVQVVKNFSHGIHGKGGYVKFGDGGTSYGGGRSTMGSQSCTPKKALLMRVETNMLLMSPITDGRPHTRGLHQLDLETGKVVTEWKFGKDLNKLLTICIIRRRLCIIRGHRL